ncbi:hypothetical protein GS501_06300 [Saccharibacter sp. 17.LH.SD]|uniref:LutC/YkgG family protein n=1 Tax=Saccharibacter sp. 17.LH.SD TaxID=2689393 RepID=UPI00136DBD74|nr:LUD domain-containing protein [Saccharibacter sp. 17.LH.SD]MXV44653.1 hypothetical protein [Saccharibacter sp. 17.LH.SD]
MAEASARETILNHLRQNRAPKGDMYPLPPIVTLGDVDASPARFEANLKLMGGDLLLQAEGKTVEESIRDHFPHAKLFCSAVPEATGMMKITELRSNKQADTVDVMVVRSPFGIAEMGSIFLSEKELYDHLAAVHLAEHLVVLLSRHALTGNMHTAYQERPEFKTTSYGVLMSGPSATADIQGVLIRGAQGVRSLSVMWTD